MRGEKAGFKRLLSVIPKGWEGKAKELGALVRGREIKDAFDLLRLVFLYLTEGKSFSGTAVLLQLDGIFDKQESGVHQISKMRGMAAVAV